MNNMTNVKSRDLISNHIISKIILKKVKKLL